MRDHPLAAPLAEFLCAQSNAPVEVTDVSRITVGHSRAMFRVECADGSRYVLRLEQGGVFGTSSAEEFGVMQALHGVGVPVAKVRWYEPSGTVLGHPFFVMDFIAGAEGAAERDLDASTASAFVRTLHGVHGLDPAALAIPFDIVPDDAAHATHRQIERWADCYRAASPEPMALLEEAAAWLHRNAPPLARLSIVHGDAGPGNFVHADGRVVAVTDWEFAHLGDPAEDWAFCVAMRGARTMSRDAWLALLASEGITLSDEEWRYWEAFNLFKGACANRTCLRLFEDGINAAPNMAIIGTALHQVFLRRLVDLVA